MKGLLMKKLILALCMVFSVGTSVRAEDETFVPTHYEMIQNLQRIINTSTNPHDIVEAERLIREVYGPAYSRELWNKIHTILAVTGIVATTFVAAIVVAAIAE